MFQLCQAIKNGSCHSNNNGNRKDKKICTARGGECRFNNKYYTIGLKDNKSWTIPSADENCPNDCPYLK